ncbi:MAG: diguanylate cyclase [FCB group bacterium]|nr:diguanylate cyclase [FCB group bacterium]
MLSTENTILENWQGPKNIELPRKPVYHFALKQDSLSIDIYLEQFFKNNKISFHFFEGLEDLLIICQRFPIDVIIIGGKGLFIKEIELVRAVKENVFLAIIPIILFHPGPDENIVIAAYQKGAEDFIYGDWREKLVEVKIKKVIERNRRDLSINPSTHLPGPNIIESEISRQINMDAEFAVCYADLDNFKAYNDYYGYYYGDKVIRLTARIIKDVVFDICREGFVGHIAGDDFIFVIPPDLVDFICGKMLETFDCLIPYRYLPEDRERSFITTTNRRGEIEQFPLLTISIAVIINSHGKFEHVGEMSKMLADLKKATKMKQGSNYMVERRQKY